MVQNLKLVLNWEVERRYSRFINTRLGILTFSIIILNLTFANFKLVAQNFDNLEIQFLTEDSLAFDYWPCFSSDGQTVLFSRKYEESTWELYKVSVRGGTAQKFSKEKLPIAATRASWSIPHNIIAFTGTAKEGNSDVWLIDSNGENPRKLEVKGLSKKIYYPSWYPEGENLAVYDVNERVIKQISLDGQPTIVLTDSTKVLTGMPSVSPNGKIVAFAGQKNIGKPYNNKLNSIWILNEVGQSQMLEKEPFQGRTPAWSPDGEWIIFESNRGSSVGNYAIFIIKADGSSLRQITPYELNANHPIWSPDGKRIVFSSYYRLEGKMKSKIGVIAFE